MIELHNVDCMEYMSTQKDNSFDLAIVDPPYGLGNKLTNGGTWANKYTFENSLWDIPPEKAYFDELMRVSKNWIVWGGNYFTMFLPPSRCFLIWDKKAKIKTLADSELALTSFDKNAKTFSHLRNTSERRIHLCQKPIKLYDWLLANYAKKGQRILDTHLGSGSIAIAAYYFGCDFVGCEIDAKFFADMKIRFTKKTRQMSMF